MRYLKDREYYYYDVKPGPKKKLKRLTIRDERTPRTDAPRMVDLTWGNNPRPRNLIAFNEPKGRWTYPKKGFIQWKKD